MLVGVRTLTPACCHCTADLYGRGYSEYPDRAHDLSLFVDQVLQLVDALKLVVRDGADAISIGYP